MTKSCLLVASPESRLDPDSHGLLVSVAVLAPIASDASHPFHAQKASADEVRQKQASQIEEDAGQSGQYRPGAVRFLHKPKTTRRPGPTPPAGT